MLINYKNFINYLKDIRCDAPFAYQASFQDPATPMFEGTIFLHDLIWSFLIGIVFFVSWMLVKILIIFEEKSYKKVNPITQNVNLETIWTLSPAIILGLLGGNSISYLYSAEESLTPSIDIIITGHQWFWSYEFIAFTKKITIESHMIPEEDLLKGELRNLEVDYPLVLPSNTNVRLIVNSDDVIHSWAVPSLGIKVDAVPGRTNVYNAFIKREGKFYGQCSEICGKGHASMPIAVHVINNHQYLTYLHFYYINEDYEFYKNWSDINFNFSKKEFN